MANYKKAPRLYHIGKKDGDKKNFIKIPQDLMESIFNQLNGRQGNVIKVILFLIGTAGDGSFGVSEKWICDSTGMLKSCYIEARKTLVELGWVEVVSGRINVKFDKIRNTDGSCEATQRETKVVLNEELVVLNDEMGCVNPNDGSCDTNCNREEQIINKEVTIKDTLPQIDKNTDIKISRRKDLEYILNLYNLTEEDIIKLIQDNNIDDADDFVNLFYLMAESKYSISGEKTVETCDVVSSYHKFHKLNEFHIKDIFWYYDILEFSSKDQSNRVFKWFFDGRNYTMEFKSQEQIDMLNKRIAEGLKINAYYFKRNFGR